MSMKLSISAVFRCLELGLLAALPQPAGAAPDRAASTNTPAATGIELIAFEAPGCIYCPILRRDVVPTYEASRAGRTAPLRFVDLNDAAADRIKLVAPITMVPTLVLVRDGVEIGRIPGYMGRENVHRLLDTMLPHD